MDGIERYTRRYALDELLSPALFEAMSPLRRGPGELLVRSGDPARRLLFLVEGKAKSYSRLANGQSVLAAFCVPLEVLGEVELFAAERYELTVEAIEPTLCLALPIPLVRREAERNAKLLAFLCGRLGEKLMTSNRAESINLRYPVEARFASYLLASMAEDGRILGSDDLGEIADYIGSSYRQLARVVRRFREEGLLDKERGRVRVLDGSGLEPLAGDLYQGRRTASIPRMERGAPLRRRPS
jgi:CRP/FNR family transcriptional regulator, putaive post-exponential-phase nitrogen-starvation regulator